jgi:hypothetical protein
MNQSVGGEQANRVIELNLKEQVNHAAKAPVFNRFVAFFARLCYIPTAGHHVSNNLTSSEERLDRSLTA